MTRLIWSRALAVIALGALAGFVSTPRGDTVAAEEEKAVAGAHTYVGGVAGSDSARIGVVCDGKKFLAYVCSQDEPFTAEHAAWFKGDCDGKSIVAKNGDKQLAASVSGATVSGTITNGGKKLAFTAKLADDSVVAGLYRAEGADGTDPVVFGWVVDEDGFVAGARQQRGRPNTPLPNTGVLNGLNGQANANAQAVRGEKVNDPAAPPKGKKAKGFSAARRQEFLTRVQAKTPPGGNPLLVNLIHTVKRFNSGAKAETKVEEGAFAQLRKAPKQALIDYEKNWEKIPVAVRERMAGPELKKMDPKKAMTAEQLKGLLASVISPRSNPTPQAASVPVVTEVKIKELKALDTTGEVKDEIFAIYVIGTSNQVFTKTTAVISNVGNDNTKKFAAADQVIFPPAEQPNLTAFEDVFVTASLFEQDGNIDLIKNLVKVLVDAAIVTVAILTAPAGAGAAGFVVPANLLIDQIAAGLPEAQPLGDDSFRATPDGKLKKVNNNTSVSELKFKETAKKGPGPFDFRLTDMSVKAK